MDEMNEKKRYKPRGKKAKKVQVSFRISERSASKFKGEAERLEISQADYFTLLISGKLK